VAVGILFLANKLLMKIPRWRHLILSFAVTLWGFTEKPAHVSMRGHESSDEIQFIQWITTSQFLRTLSCVRERRTLPAIRGFMMASNGESIMMHGDWASGNLLEPFDEPTHGDAVTSRRVEE